MEPAGSENPVPVAGRRPLRFAARACDLAVTGYVFGVIVIEVRGRLLGGDPLATRPLAGAQDPGELLVILAAVIVLLDTLPMAVWGRTLGKAMVGLRTVRVDLPGHSPGFVRALLRTMLVYGWVVLPPVVGAPVVGVLLLSMLVLRGGRGLHDRLAGTIVVDAPRPDPPAGPVPDPFTGPRPKHPDDT